MNGIIIHINGWPGVGKSAVGQLVATRLSARFVPNHSLAAPAFTVTDFDTPAYNAVTAQVLAAVLEAIASAPSDENFVLTSVLTEGAEYGERFATLQKIARGRGQPLLAVTLDCDIETNAKRLDGEGRAARRSLTNKDVLRYLRRSYTLLAPAGTVVLDVSRAAPAETADQVMELAARLSGQG